MNRQMQRPNPGVTELSGRPGTIWGSLVFPGRGKITMRIEGGTLQEMAQSRQNPAHVAQRQAQPRQTPATNQGSSVFS
ncbi:MAG TPA: hypothetical protein V6C46_01190 [Coleofasciculaceae cyanobacterium]